MNKKKTGGAEVLRKAVRVLELIGHSPNPLSVAEIAAKAGITRPTAHRLITVLEEEGFIRTDARTAAPCLGPKLLELAHLTWDAFDLRSAAFAELQRLSEATGHFSQLFMREGDRMLCIDSVGLDQSRSGKTVGHSLPVARSAAGDAVLAFDNPSPEQAGFAEDSPEDENGNQRRLDIARARYYAIDDAEFDPGFRTVAAPIFDQSGRAVAALTVSAPVYQVKTDWLHEIGPDVMEAVRRTSRAAGGYPFAMAPDDSGPGTQDSPATVIVDSQALIGDSPHIIQDRLVWIDLLAPTVNVSRRDGSEHEAVPMHDIVGAAVPHENGTLTLALRSGLVAFDPMARTITAFPKSFNAPIGKRVNDGGRDTHGRLWLGIMDVRILEGSGSLARCNERGEIDMVLDGWSLPNGIAWNQSGSRMFVVDSAKQGIFAIDYDQSAGTPVGAPQRIVTTPGQSTRPASLSIDGEGNLWTCLWDGWRLLAYTQGGDLIHDIPLPVPRPSGCLATDTGIIVTSARARLGQTNLRRAPLSGSVLLVKSHQGR